MLLLGQFSQKRTLAKFMPVVLPLGEQGRKIEIFRTIEAWGASRKAASWQFPILQKESRQNIPERVKHSPSLAASA
jgi:hypothetical protein